MNIQPQRYKIDSLKRAELKNHKSLLIWFTGLSGSGKSTLADRCEELLFEKRIHTYSLDGDNVRDGLCKDLGFSSKDRKENIRRIGEVSSLMLDAGVVVLASFISPYETDRESIKQLVGESNFVEIYLSTPLEECERRDVKGLYKKARTGEIVSFTGISAPYEPPQSSDLKIDTSQLSIEEASQQVLQLILSKL